ncbi:hypothetical protein [Nitrososphaera sp.]|uniref:hypothetical protein n=1 Tax=Nitrososphaera sp. TaxID=1971748 RepID=UPI0031799801
MPVALDSYMGMFLPADIQKRITRFLSGDMTFPYVQKEEKMGAFFIFGKDFEIHGDVEINEAKDLARRTVEQAAKEIRMYQSNPGRLDPAFTRENYTKRMLQIAVDTRGMSQEEMNRRVAGDPTILLDCFAQHVAHFAQNFYFEIFGPLAKEQVPAALQKKLEGRMVLLGYNAKSAKELPFSPLVPFFDWLSKIG